MPGMNSSAPCVPKCKDSVGGEVFPNSAIEAGEGVRRREALLEQKTHRIAFVSKRRLYANEYIPEPFAKDEKVRAIGIVPAGRRTPLALYFLEPALPPNVVVVTRTATFASTPNLAALPSKIRTRKSSTVSGTSTLYPASFRLGECVMNDA